jgi:hypothetical protein
MTARGSWVRYCACKAIDGSRSDGVLLLACGSTEGGGGWEEQRGSRQQASAIEVIYDGWVGGCGRRRWQDAAVGGNSTNAASTGVVGFFFLVS